MLTIVVNIVPIKDPTESAAQMAIHTVRIVGQAHEIRTYRIGEQTRFRRVCAYAHTRLGLRCSHTQIINVDEDIQAKEPLRVVNNFENMR